jgi:hypothetical protein
MSDFTIYDDDYEEYITSAEKLDIFEQMQALLPQLVGVHISKCWKQIEQFENLRLRLIGEDRQIQIVPIGNEKISKNPQLN